MQTGLKFTIIKLRLIRPRISRVHKIIFMKTLCWWLSDNDSIFYFRYYFCYHALFLTRSKSEHKNKLQKNNVKSGANGRNIDVIESTFLWFQTYSRNYLRRSEKRKKSEEEENEQRRRTEVHEYVKSLQIRNQASKIIGKVCQTYGYNCPVW